MITTSLFFIIFLSLVSLCLAFWAGLTYRDVRQERANRIVDTALTCLDTENKNLGQRVRKLEQLISLSTD